MKPRVSLSKSDGQINIVAPIDARREDLIAAAKFAYAKAQRTLHPGKKQTANQAGFLAASKRADGATWHSVTADLAVLLERDNLDERQVRSWVTRWDRITAMIQAADDAGLLKEDDSG